MAPDGRIPMSVLRNATIFVPPWPAGGPSGWLTFNDGLFVEPHIGDVRVTAVAYGDVDRDGAQETVVNVHGGYTYGSWQLLALDRTSAGKIRTIGPVVATTGQVKRISDSFTVTPAGLVKANLADFLVRADEDQTIPQWQTRVYGWRSSRFVQVAGPRSFPPNPRVTELSVTASALVLGQAESGLRHGTLRVTVTVNKPVAPHHVALTFDMAPSLLREGNGWTSARVEEEGHGWLQVHLDNLPSPTLGKSQTFTFGFARAQSVTRDNFVTVTAESWAAKNKYMVDLATWNNATTVEISTVG
ncbi:hypothetical protein [Phytohabitans houttuyneae]|uniref:Uncharacterized protein n=1 Tax=Phytohabitans houttuyneae TaxID=1076126 RepID=A0A6V8KFZ8_9ACTN|nr:hypothetical protein [Phytohabitans houttuyneae]GFJ81411.1 hypothetical protein Phou_055910 [Phytohabitans houttuyneae]